MNPISATSNSPLIPKAIEPVVQTGVQGIEQYSLSKPSLSLPRKVMNIAQAYEQIGKNMMELHLDSMQRNSQELDLLRREKLKQVKEATKRTFWESAWDTLKTIATCVFAAITAFFGFSVAGTAGAAGAALVASGFLSLASLIATKTGFWDWLAALMAREDKEKEQQLAKILPGAFGIFCGLLSGVGLTGSWHLLQHIQQRLVILKAAENFLEGVLEITKGHQLTKLYQEEADRISLESQIKQHELNMDKEIKTVEYIGLNQKQMQKGASSILKNTHQSIESILASRRE